MPKLFISYRRDDTGHLAGRLYDGLCKDFDSRHVFKDVDSMPAGIDFRTHLLSVLNQSDFVLVLIGKNWLGATYSDGTRRLDNPDDLVRREIESALGHDLVVIPVLTDGISMPSPDQLPESMRGLCGLHAVPLRTDPDFRTDLARLRKHLVASRVRKKRTTVTWPRYLVPLLVTSLLAVAIQQDWIPLRLWLQKQQNGLASVESGQVPGSSTANNSPQQGNEPTAILEGRESPETEIIEPSATIQSGVKEITIPPASQTEEVKMPDIPQPEDITISQPPKPQLKNTYSGRIKMPLAKNGQEQAIPDKPMDSPFGEGPWTVWVAMDGLQPRSEADLTSHAMVVNRLDFLQKVLVLARHSVPNIGPLLLVARGDLNNGTVTELLGWVREDYVMTSNGALRLTDTRICKKAFCVTREENPDVSKPFPFRKGPDLNAKISQEKAAFFDVYYVFAETRNADYSNINASKNQASDDYVLLSTSQTIPTGKTADKVILGWLPKSKVVAWNTAEAIEWDSESRKSRKNPGRVYATVSQAKEALDNPDANVPFLIEENGMPLSPGDMRYPRIEMDSGDSTMIPSSYRGNRLFRVGVIARVGAKEFQSFREGYVWGDSAEGVRQAKIVAMVEQAELKRLNDGVKEVLGITNKVIRKSKTVEEGMLELTNVMAKEKSPFDPKVSVEEQLFKKTGLTAKTPLLRKAMSEDGRSARLKLQEINDIAHRCELIDDILDGKERKWVEVQREGLIYYESRGEAVQKPRAWSSKQLHEQGSSILYYWIDTEKELP